MKLRGGRWMYVFPLSILAVLAAACPPTGPQLKLDLNVTHQRTQTSTEFTIKGSGYSSSSPVKVSLVNEPGPGPSPRDVSTVTTDAAGNFTTFYTAAYRSGLDPGQTINPFFVGSDFKTSQFATHDVLSAFWYP
jgi:hypothetical protein